MLTLAKWTAVFLLCLAVLAVPVDAQTPTPNWVNFYNSNTTLNGKPVPVGSVERAYDPEGVLCGKYEVSVAGAYGFLACYIDDPNTSEDESIELGALWIHDRRFPRWGV